MLNCVGRCDALLCWDVPRCTRTAPLVNAGHFSLAQAIQGRISDARRSAPAVVHLPNIERWSPQHTGIEEGVATIHSELEQALSDELLRVPSTLPILVLATSDVPRDRLSPWARGVSCHDSRGVVSTVQDGVSLSGVLDLEHPTQALVAGFFNGAWGPH